MSNPVADPSRLWEEGGTSNSTRSSITVCHRDLSSSVSTDPRHLFRLCSCRSSSPPPDGDERLTDDLLVDILSRVPAKSLCRFLCVSNHWISLIEHPDHRKGLPQTMSGFFYGRIITEEHERLPGPPVHFTSAPGRRGPPMDTSCDFLPNHGRVDLLDCCNGLLLCRWYAEVDGSHYLVCNPATRKWALLPDSGQTTGNVATARLGFNPDLSPHFHVFELLQDSCFWNGDHLTGVEVYSSETGKWVHKNHCWNEQLRVADPNLPTAFLNGYLHFLAFGRESSHHFVAAVDTEGGRWRRCSVPGGLGDGIIQQSQGCLHYANFQRDSGGAVVHLVVYVLEDYASKKWTLKHIVETSCIFGDIRVLFRDFNLIAIHPDCNLIFFAAGWTKFICYNTESRQVQVICNREDGRPPFLPYVPLYSELQSLA